MSDNSLLPAITNSALTSLPPLVNENLVPLPDVDLKKTTDAERLFCSMATLLFNIPPKTTSLFTIKDTKENITAFTGELGQEELAPEAKIRDQFSQNGYPFIGDKIAPTKSEDGKDFVVSDQKQTYLIAPKGEEELIVSQQQFDKGLLQMMIDSIDKTIDEQLNAVLHNEDFQHLESTWRSVYDIAQVVEWNNEDFPVKMDLWDVTKQELGEDLRDNSMSPNYGILYDNIYIKEYDQYGGSAFGAMVGLYDFTASKPDIEWLTYMSKVANAAYAPFIATASPKFFGCETIEQLAAVKDINSIFEGPAYSFWKKFRKDESSGFIGLSLPHYMARLPYDPDTNPDLSRMRFKEDVFQYTKNEFPAFLLSEESWKALKADPNKFVLLPEAVQQEFDDNEFPVSQITFITDNPYKADAQEKSFLIFDKYQEKQYIAIEETNAAGEKTHQIYKVKKEAAKKFLWGSSATLFGQNLMKSFQNFGWCQHIRGPIGGGLIDGLPVFSYTLDSSGEESDDFKVQIPVEMMIPDYLEWQFAKNGFIPLIYRKGNDGVATFFSCQSAKSSKLFVEKIATQASQMVTNLAYTFSISRIAHYIRSIMRDNIGSSADSIYINNILTNWLSNYVTTVTDPNDLTLQRYPFKAISIKVTPNEDAIGAYFCEIQVVPHIQFEELRVELLLRPVLAAS